jgi:hypothetical protein
MAMAVRGASLLASEPTGEEFVPGTDRAGPLGGFAELAHMMMDADGAVIEIFGGKTSSSLRPVDRLRLGAAAARMCDPAFAWSQGFAAFAALPLRDDKGEELGRIAVFAKAARDFADQDLMLLRKLGDLIRG